MIAGHGVDLTDNLDSSQENKKVPQSVDSVQSCPEMPQSELKCAVPENVPQHSVPRSLRSVGTKGRYSSIW